MSHHALQRTIVRMLFDPAFVDRVYAGERLGDLSEEERRWLTEPDARAWRTDPHRRARTLHALLEEFPASAALSGDARDLIAFFSSDVFHACVREDGSLALSFGAWLAAHLTGVAGDVARIETAIARVRRARRRVQGSRLALSPRAELLEVDAAASQLHANVVRRLGADPVALLARGPIADLAAIAPWGAREILLVHRHDGVALERLPDALAALLDFAREPRTRTALVDEACRLGADAEEADVIVADLERDRLLGPA